MSVATALELAKAIKELIVVPTEKDFGGRAYKKAPELAEYADRLYERHQMPLLGGNIAWFWKREGSKKDRACAAGGQQVVSGLLEIGHPDAAYVAWIAADILAEELGADKLETVVFHRLCHLGTHVKTGAAIILPHEFTGFAAEVANYGFWSGPLQSLAEQAKQLTLPMGDEPSLPPELDGRIWGPVRQGED